MIINPVKIHKDSLPEIDFDTLKELVLKTDEEIYSLRLNIKRDKHKLGPNIVTDFLRDSIIINSDLLISTTQISHNFINSIIILYRTFLEMKIDFLWFYSHYMENEKVGVILAKRYYQISRNNFLKFAPNFKRIEKTDPFFKDIKNNFSIEDDISRAKLENYIELVNPDEKDKKIKYLQRTDWHAVPGLYESKNQINFTCRAKVASELAQKLFNLKAAPYIENWKLLNQFSHPTAMQYKIIDEKLSKKLQCRNLNIFLGFLHDMINVMCHYMKIEPNAKIREIRLRFNYMSL